MASYPGRERRRLPLNALRAFEAAAAKGSFTAGAEALSITQSALSRHVLGLEQVLDCQLFLRTANGAILTEEGEHLLAHVTRAFDDVANAIATLKSRRRLRLFVAPSFLQMVPPALLQQLRKDQPRLQLDLISDNATGPGEQVADLAVTFEHLPLAPSHEGRLLWTIALTPACRQDDADQIVSRGLAAVIAHGDLLHIRLSGRHRQYLWSRFASATGTGPIPPGGIVFETQVQALEYARIGGGLMLVDSRLVPRLGDYGLTAPFTQRVAIDYGYVLSASAGVEDDAIRLLRAELMALAG